MLAVGAGAGQVVSVHPAPSQSPFRGVLADQNFTHPHGEPYWNVHMSHCIRKECTTNLCARGNVLFDGLLNVSRLLGSYRIFLQQWKGQNAEVQKPSGKLIIIAKDYPHFQ